MIQIVHKTKFAAKGKNQGFIWDEYAKGVCRRLLPTTTTEHSICCASPGVIVVIAEFGRLDLNTVCMRFLKQCCLLLISTCAINVSIHLQKPIFHTYCILHQQTVHFLHACLQVPKQHVNFSPVKSVFHAFHK